MTYSRLQSLAFSLLFTTTTLALIPVAQASPTIGNTTSDSNTGEYWGQSFTTPAGSAVELTGFSFGLGQGTPVGKLYAFSQPYTGAGTLASAGTSLGSATFNSGSGVYDFSADAIVLQPSTKYYIYSDSFMNVKYSTANPYSGGEAYFSINGGSFSPLSTDDTYFSVQIGPVPVPEPSAYALALAGVATLGLVRRQRFAFAAK